MVLSRGQNNSPNNLHGQQVLHVCDLGLSYPTAACKAYDTVTFSTLIPPLHRSRSYNVAVNCTLFLNFCPFPSYVTNNKFILNSIFSKRIIIIRLYKYGQQSPIDISIS